VPDLDDLDPEMADFLVEVQRSYKVRLGCGAKDIFIYVRTRRARDLIERMMPATLRNRIRVIVYRARGRR